MDQLIFASLSHTHYWYRMGMLKVPAVKPSEMPTKLESTPTHRVFLKVGAVFSRFISSRRWKPALSDGSWGCDTLWTRNLRVQVAIIVRGSRRDLGDSACDVEFSTAVDVQILLFEILASTHLLSVSILYPDCAACR